MITAKQLSEAYISGANNIENNRQKVDALNVFPVPDGDTGTNMSMTMGAAREDLLHNDYPTVGDVAGKAASALLRDVEKRPETFVDLKAIQAKVREICTHTDC